MHQYRVYFIDEHGHFQKTQVLDSPDDKAVIAEAKNLVDGLAIEVWHLDRMVVRLDRKE